MKNFFFLIIYFFFLVSFSQNHVAKGIVLDENTKAPIPYVNISILKSQIGTSSHEDGSYHLEIFKEDLDKDIKLSSLGYKDSTISVNRFLRLNTISLKPIVEQLEEIVISEKIEERTLIVNKIEEDDLCQGYGSHVKNPWILALYFPFDETYETTDYLKSVRFHFGNFKNKKAKYRLRLFSIGKDSLPDKDLLKESLVVELKKKQKIANVDISDYNIIFPRNGFFIAFEWLYIPYNEEKVTYVYGPKNKKKRKDIKYNPTLSGICVEEGTYKVAVYNSGKWYFYTANKYKSTEKVVPAISLTLSN